MRSQLRIGRKKLIRAKVAAPVVHLKQPEGGVKQALMREGRGFFREGASLILRSAPLLDCKLTA